MARGALWRAFEAIDVDHSGTIERDELLDALRDPVKVELLIEGVEALRPLSRPDMVGVMFDAMDVDGENAGKKSKKRAKKKKGKS